MKSLKSTCAKVTAALLAAVLVCSLIVPAFAADAGPNTPKEEVVYINLNADGSVREINAVNIFELDEAGHITDYGDYESLRNMTTRDVIDYSDDLVTVDAEAGKLYYEGRLNSLVMPWDISIRYYLDGKEYSAEEIAGKSGALKIAVRITENTRCRGGFFDQYALQASLTLDTDLCENIVADGATVANVGRNKQLTYTILPGKGAEFTITADVTDFEMDSVSINGIPLHLNLEIDDSDLTESVGELQDAIAELDDGAGTLSDGVSALRDGADDLKGGLASLDEGIQALESGAAQMQGALDALHTQSAPLTNGSAEIKAALGQLQTALSGMSAASPELAALAASVDTLVQQYEMFDGGLTEYTKAVAQCAAGYTQISGSTTQLAEGSGALVQGAAGLLSGINEVYDGSAILKNGTASLRAETADMDEKITDQISAVQESIAGEDTEIQSFVSEKNTQVKSVQFVIQAEGVRQEEPPQPAPEEPAPLTLWQKFLRLFGLY